jgi:hypothetical protein
MSAPINVRADGMDWPLDTYIDAYGYTRLDHLSLTPNHPLLSRCDMLDAVTNAGELITNKPARHLPWGDVSAIRSREGSTFRACDICGSFDEVFQTGFGLQCDDCRSCNEWEDFAPSSAPSPAASTPPPSA